MLSDISCSVRQIKETNGNVRNRNIKKKKSLCHGWILPWAGTVDNRAAIAVEGCCYEEKEESIYTDPYEFIAQPVTVRRQHTDLQKTKCNYSCSPSHHLKWNVICKANSFECGFPCIFISSPWVFLIDFVTNVCVHIHVCLRPDN